MLRTFVDLLTVNRLIRSHYEDPHSKSSQVAANRWHLALMLIRFPMLRALRRHLARDEARAARAKAQDEMLPEKAKRVSLCERYLPCTRRSSDIEADIEDEVMADSTDVAMAYALEAERTKTTLRATIEWYELQITNRRRELALLCTMAQD